MAQIFARNFLLTNLTKQAPKRSVRLFTKSVAKQNASIFSHKKLEKCMSKSILHDKNYLQNYGTVITQTSNFHRTSRLLDKDDDSKNDQPPDQSKMQNNNSMHSPLVMAPMNALAPLQVPEVFPNVPLVAVSRNPLFPRYAHEKILIFWQ